MRLERIPQEELRELVVRLDEARQKAAVSSTIALISDIHSNYWALKAVLEDIIENGTGEILCAGDVVGYGPRPNECCYLLRLLQIPTVMGNHDYGAVHPEDPEVTFNNDAELAKLWTSAVLDKENHEWIGFLPKKETRDGIYVTHGSPQDPMKGYVSEGEVENKVGGFLSSDEGRDVKAVVLGHTHIPYVRKVNDAYVINPGSVGQPRDGNARASYTLIDVANGTLKVEGNIRVGYDIGRTAEEIRSLLLPEKLASRLLEGG